LIVQALLGLGELARTHLDEQIRSRPIIWRKEKRESRTVQQIRWVQKWITGGNLPRSIPEAIWGKPPVSVFGQSKLAE
jgi:hypothetical protein